MLLTPVAVFTAFSYKCPLGSLISNHCGPSPQPSPILPKNIMVPFLDFCVMIFFISNTFQNTFVKPLAAIFFVVFVWTWISQKLKIQTWNFQCPFLPSKWINSCEIGTDGSKNVSVLRTLKKTTLKQSYKAPYLTADSLELNIKKMSKHNWWLFLNSI